MALLRISEELKDSKAVVKRTELHIVKVNGARTLPLNETLRKEIVTQMGKPNLNKAVNESNSIIAKFKSITNRDLTAKESYELYKAEEVRAMIKYYKTKRRKKKKVLGTVTNKQAVLYYKEKIKEEDFKGELLVELKRLMRRANTIINQL